jgi:hypothetical protein
MAISKIGGTGSDNWELISSVTPTVSTAAVNFTGLGVYKKLMVVCKDLNYAASATLRLRLNNDSGTNYSWTAWESTPDLQITGNDTSIKFSPNNTPMSIAVIAMTSCDNSGIKLLEMGFGGNTLTEIWKLENAIYLANAVVSQVNVIIGSTFLATGTVALYGVK